MLRGKYFRPLAIPLDFQSRRTCLHRKNFFSRGILLHSGIFQSLAFAMHRLSKTREYSAAKRGSGSIARERSLYSSLSASRASLERVILIRHAIRSRQQRYHAWFIAAISLSPVLASLRVGCFEVPGSRGQQAMRVATCVLVDRHVWKVVRTPITRPWKQL